MRALGRTGLEVSSICLGTMTFGDQTPQADAFAQMDRAVAHGVNFFDTAELYSSPPKAETFGVTEEVIGRWLQERGGRDKLIIASKVSGRGEDWLWPRPENMRDGGKLRQTRRQIDYALENSLRRLGTDYLDLYQLHWPDRAFAGFGYKTYRDYPDDYEAFETVLESLAWHVEKGAVRAIGLSNESPWGVMRYLHEAEKRGLPRMASIQNAYSLVNRRFETGGLAEVSLREDIGLLAYSPLAQGQLTGKYRGGTKPEGSRWALYNRMQRYDGPRARETIEAYVSLAEELGVSPVALALKFVDTRPWTTSTIIGASQVDQLEDNLAAFDLVWTDEMETRVNAIHAAQPDPCP